MPTLRTLQGCLTLRDHGKIQLRVLRVIALKANRSGECRNNKTEEPASKYRNPHLRQLAPICRHRSAASRHRNSRRPNPLPDAEVVAVALRTSLGGSQARAWRVHRANRCTDA